MSALPDFNRYLSVTIVFVVTSRGDYTNAQVRVPFQLV
jgi:hypothetical protein